MKQIKLCLIAVLLVTFSGGCEPDDICAANTPTTPKLIIRFYNAANPTELKSVENLATQGVGNELIYTVASTDSLSIPLQSQSTSTSFVLTKNFADPITSDTNADQINLSYDVAQVYISRACGFKAQYELNEATIETDSDLWIQSIEISSSLIENETKAHVKIYH